MGVESGPRDIFERCKGTTVTSGSRGWGSARDWSSRRAVVNTTVSVVQWGRISER